MKNCLNCGMPFDVERNKCAYCGTSYFDMSSIEVGTGKPFILKLKYGNVIITQLVRADYGNIELKRDMAEVKGGPGGVTLGQMNYRDVMETKLEFTTVMKNGKLMEVEVAE